jgi:hypothetical protein
MTLVEKGVSSSFSFILEKKLNAYSQTYGLVNITTGTGWGMKFCVGNTGDVPRLGFPSICLQDSPLGVRYADLVSGWPAAITVAGLFTLLSPRHSLPNHSGLCFETFEDRNGLKIGVLTI